ncbi:MAG: TolC family protein [Bacteroidales bacterium]|nr:TolC family protein [Bacteroidales bacterium]MCK9479932.1 TolC family protein [Bacillota bacterium]
MKRIIALNVLFLPAVLFAQQQLSLEESYNYALKNNPLRNQADWLKEKSDAEISILEKGKLPKLDVNAQATYQSDVVHFPGSLPNMSIVPPNKDQYRATVDVSQLIYKGGAIQAQTKLKEAELQTLQQQVEVGLYGLKYQVNQYYFNVLLKQEQAKLLELKKQQLQERLNEVKAAVKYGAALTSSEKILEAELLKLSQEQTQVDADRKKALEQLSQLLHLDVAKDLVLENPNLTVYKNEENLRPELKLFALQENQLTVSEAAIAKEVFPIVSGFAQAGYGNPGLNMLDNSFQDFYIVGIRLNWNIFDWGQNKQKKNIIRYNKEIVSTERENFLLQTVINEQAAYNDIIKYEGLLQKDDEIINLREEVLTSVTSQLKNGTIRSSEYIIELNNLFEAKIDKQLHEIQLSLSKANYNVIVGK